MMPAHDLFGRRLPDAGDNPSPAARRGGAFSLSAISREDG